MRIRTRTGTKVCHDVDIYQNPKNPGRSRIPYDVCDYVIEDFLKNEIIVAKLCACPSCDARRNVLRKLQTIHAEWKHYKELEMRRKQREHERECHCNNQERR